MARTTTLSSAGTATIILDPTAKATTVMLTATGTSTGAILVEMSLDDPSLFGGPTATWAPLSSATLTSSTIAAAPLTWNVQSPLGGVRLNSSAMNTGNVMTLKALQSVTA